jgi:hypothetical protein
MIKNTVCNFKWLLSLIFYAFGLFLSLKVVSGSFGVEPDTSHSLMLWYGVNEHGLSWVKDWLFTQDNWLFSLVPVHFLEFWILGPKPSLVIITGWAIFVASTIAAGLIGLELKSKNSFYIIPVVLIFMGLYAHQSGFVSYSTSHNITNLFGLLSTLAFIRWVKTKKWHLIALIFFLQVTGGLSDPWLIPAYTLPTALVAVILFFKSGKPQERKQYFWLFAAVAVSMVSIKTMFFGMLNFLPRMNFVIGDWGTINSNAVFLIKDLGGLFNLLPGAKTNFFVSSSVSLAAILVLYVTGMRLVIPNGLAPPRLAFFSLVFFSTGGISLAFLISDVPAADYSARFLINILYLITVAVAVSFEENWHRTSILFKGFSITVVSLFMIAGFFSNLYLPKEPRFLIKSTEAHELIAFLTMNRLNYGYGPYWGSNANAVTILSNSQIRIRPVSFDKSSGRIIFGNHPESSKRWYSTDDFPVNQKDFFVVVNDDGEECPIPQICINGLARQYGKPLRMLTYKNSLILVWNHPLIGWNKNDYVKIKSDTKIMFDSSNPNPIPPWQGWSHPELGGTWSDGDTSLVLLALSSLPKNDVELLIEGSAFLTDKNPSQEVDILVNKLHVATLKYDQQANGGIRTVKIPKRLALENNGHLLIKFNFKNPKSPAELGLAYDSRRLGLSIVSLELKSVD